MTALWPVKVGTLTAYNSAAIMARYRPYDVLGQDRCQGLLKNRNKKLNILCL